MIEDWPQDIGGKPSFSYLENMPAFVPIMFELTVFFAAHLMVITFYLRSRMWPFKNAENPEDTRKQKIKEYKDKFANPYVAAAYGYIDAVIEPKETRNFILHALEVSSLKVEISPTKKHGVPPF